MGGDMRGFLAARSNIKSVFVVSQRHSPAFKCYRVFPTVVCLACVQL